MVYGILMMGYNGCLVDFTVYLGFSVYLDFTLRRSEYFGQTVSVSSWIKRHQKVKLVRDWEDCIPAPLTSNFITKASAVVSTLQSQADIT